MKNSQYDSNSGKSEEDTVQEYVKQAETSWLTGSQVLFLLKKALKGEVPLTKVQQTPPSGSIMLFDRTDQKTSYKADGYGWKKKKASNSVRADCVKLMVDSKRKVLAQYYHSDSIASFKRRTYIEINCEEKNHVVVVHYLDNELNSAESFVKHPHQCTCLGCYLYGNPSGPMDGIASNLYHKEMLLNSYGAHFTVEDIPEEELRNICIRTVAPLKLYIGYESTQVLVCLCQPNGSPLHSYYPYEKCKFRVFLIPSSPSPKIQLDGINIMPGVLSFTMPNLASLDSRFSFSSKAKVHYYQVQLEVNGVVAASRLLDSPASSSAKLAVISCTIESSQNVASRLPSSRYKDAESAPQNSKENRKHQSKKRSRMKDNKALSTPNTQMNISELGEEELSEIAEKMLEDTVAMMIDLSREETSLADALDSLDRSGYNLFHYTVIHNHIRLVQLLLQHGASIDTPTKAGETALHLACENGYARLCEILLSNGASPFSVNKNKLTPYQLARRKHHQQAALVCEKYMATGDSKHYGRDRLASIPEPEIEFELEPEYGNIEVDIPFGDVDNKLNVFSLSDTVGFEEDDGFPSNFDIFCADSTDKMPMQDGEAENKHTALLREALASMSLKDRCALSLGMAKRSPSFDSYGAGMGWNSSSANGLRRRADSEAEVQSIVSEHEHSLNAAMSAMHEDERAELEQEATVIQKNFRKWMLKRNLERSRRARSATMETLARARANSASAESVQYSNAFLEEQATKVQAVGKGFLARREYKQTKHDANQLQAAVRARLARREFAKLRRQVISILTIQWVVKARQQQQKQRSPVPN